MITGTLNLAYVGKKPTFTLDLADGSEFVYSLPGIFRKGTTIEVAEKIVKKLALAKIYTNQLLKEELLCQNKKFH